MKKNFRKALAAIIALTTASSIMLVNAPASLALEECDNAAFSITEAAPIVTSSDDDYFANMEITPEDYFDYDFKNDAIQIKGLVEDCDLTEIRIPDTISDYPVNAILKDAFYGSKITSIYIPD
ncbi:MAG: hypothetical protein K2H01_00530, partial [Ruminococcus sp.]|nr:hypothetical protein [Ruminococcus sp.]